MTQPSDGDALRELIFTAIRDFELFDYGNVGRALYEIQARFHDFAAARAQVEALAARPGLPSEPSDAAVESAFDAHLREWKKVPRPNETRQSNAEVRALMIYPMAAALRAAYAAERAAAEGAQP